MSIFRRWRSKKHLKNVADLGCILCGKEACAHHISGHGDSGMGTKPSDSMCFPLCANHHTGRDGIHKVGVLAWEDKFGTQYKHLAKTLSRLLEGE